VNGGKKVKSQGFCAIGKCEPLSIFLLIESLLTACKFHPFFGNMELFI
jgi:hypothetical protein